MLWILMACGFGGESYQTTGDIYVLEADCVEGKAQIVSQHSAVHLIGVDVCYGYVEDGCNLSPAPGSVRRGNAMITVECSEQDYGADAYVRARFLELAPSPQ